MPATLTVDDRGCLTAEIEGAGGELFSYAVSVTADDADLFALVLRKLGGDAEPYRVEKPSGRAWTCTCADTTYKGFRRRNQLECKHTRTARAVKALFALHPSHHEKQLVPKGVAS